MSIALNHLRRHRVRLQLQPTADIGLDRRRQVREGADGARNLADADDLARAAQARQVALQLGVPQRQLQAERHRLGVHAVRAANHGRVPVLVGPRTDGLGQRIDVPDDQIGRLDHLQRQRGVDDVGGRQAEMQIPRRRPHMLGHRRRERNHVVMRRLLDFLDARDVEPRARPELACGVVRDDAGVGHRVGGRELDLEPRLIAPLLGPDAPHLGVGVAGNHLSAKCEVESAKWPERRRKSVV